VSDDARATRGAYVASKSNSNSPLGWRNFLPPDSGLFPFSRTRHLSAGRFCWRRTARRAFIITTFTEESERGDVEYASRHPLETRARRWPGAHNPGAPASRAVSFRARRSMTSRLRHEADSAVYGGKVFSQRAWPVCGHRGVRGHQTDRPTRHVEAIRNKSHVPKRKEKKKKKKQKKKKKKRKLPLGHGDFLF